MSYCGHLISSALLVLIVATFLPSSTGYLVPNSEDQWVLDAVVDQLLQRMHLRHPEQLNFLKLSDDKVSFSYSVLGFAKLTAEATISKAHLRGYQNLERGQPTEATVKDGRTYMTAHLVAKDVTFDGLAKVKLVGVSSKEVRLEGSIKELQLQVSFYPQEEGAEVDDVKLTALKGFDVDVKDSGVLAALASAALTAFKTSLEKKFESNLAEDMREFFTVVFA